MAQLLSTLGPNLLTPQTHIAPVQTYPTSEPHHAGKLHDAQNLIVPKSLHVSYLLMLQIFQRYV